MKNPQVCLTVAMALLSEGRGLEEWVGPEG